MIFKRTFVIVVFVLVVCCSCVFSQTFKIGALLDKKNFRQKAAFREAIDAANEKYGIVFEAIVEEDLKEDDPFTAMKLTCSLLSKGVIGILGPLSEDNSNMVQSILDAKEVPHIEVRWDDYPQNGTVINIHPFPDTLTRTYFDLINAWNWYTFVIMYENNEGLQRVGELIKMFEPLKHTIILKQLDPKRNEGNYWSVLKEVWRSGAKRFVLDCSVEILPLVLQQAQQVGLMTSEHHYIITNLDAHTIDLAPYMHSETNITLMRFVDPHDENFQDVAARIHGIPLGFKSEAGFLLRVQEALIYDAIMMFAEAVNTFKNIIKPRMIACESSESSFLSGIALVNEMKSMTHPGLTGNISFGISGFRSEIALDIVELKEGGQTVIGDWNSTRICHHPVCPLHILRHFEPTSMEDVDIINKTFLVMTTLTEPYGMLVDSNVPLVGNDRYEGFAIDVIKELSKMLGFNYTFVIREDKANGEQVDGKWTGMIGNITDGPVDLAITDLTITMERETAVDFTSPFMMLGINILYQKATKAPPSFFSFADPFASEVWKLIFAAWIGISLILFILGRISPTEWENPYPCIEEPEFLVNQLDLRNCFWFVTGSIMQQGSEIELKSVSTRMIAGMWWFFTLLMVSSYTANLAAFLTTEKPDPHFTNFEDLVKKADDMKIKYGAKKGGATLKLFEEKAKNDSNSPFGLAWKFMQEHKDEVFVDDNTKGVTKAQNERYALFMEDTSIEYETERKCDLEQVGDRLDEKGYGIAMKKNFIYRNILSRAVLELLQSGKIADLKRKWWQERKGGGQCNADADSAEATPLNLSGVEGVFWVTIGGTILAIFLAVLETIINTTKKSIRRRVPFRDILLEEIKFYFRLSESVKQVTYSKDTSRQNSGSRDIPEIEIGWVHRQNSVDMTSNASRRSSRSRRSRSRRNNRSRSKKIDKQNSTNTC